MTRKVSDMLEENDEVSIIKVTNENKVRKRMGDDYEGYCLSSYRDPAENEVCIIKVNGEVPIIPEKENGKKKVDKVNEFSDVDIYLCNDFVLRTKSSFYNNHRKEIPELTIEKIGGKEEKAPTVRSTAVIKGANNAPDKIEIFYECNECKMSYRNHQVYQKHMEKHLMQQQYFFCNICDESFEKQASLKYHTIVKHGDIRDLMTKAQRSKFHACDQCDECVFEKHKEHECDECHSKFKTVTDLRAHMETDHCGEFEIRMKTRHICRKCNKSYNSQIEFLNHMEEHGFELFFGCKELQCKDCKIWFYDSKDLVTHIQMTHKKEKKYPCKGCDEVFTCPNKLEAHMEVHKRVKPYPCTQCDKSFCEKSLLLKHLDTHTDFKCSFCGKGFTSSAGLGVHERIHKGPDELQCTQCDEKFYSRNTLRYHMRTHRVSPYQCTICKETFQGYSVLAAHMRFHTGEKRYKCPKCEKKFATLVELNTHERTHVQEKPHGCGECNERFATRNELLAHNKKHPQQKYVCGVCKSEFVGKRIYLQHMKLHEKRKKFTCNECGEKFVNVSPYLSHLKTHKK